tara:strand:- start:768 stop:1373 length:606 start_codon:yes stop_codon:yes gene_type:complete
MVKIDKKSFLRVLNNPNKINKDNYKSFLKLSKDYPFFNSVHLINLFISKKFSSIEYEKNLKNFSLKFIDRKYLYNILKDDGFFTKKEVIEIINDLKTTELKNKNSFLEWISKTKSVENIQPSKNFGIDKSFISNLKFKQKNKSNKITKEDFMTETLAKVYLKQNKLNEALKAYKILSLKYPEKISLFADQIKFIKNKLKNE